jgi:nucleotide-binding universal stress UspA family protein
MRNPKRMETIVVPLDFSEHSEEALEYAMWLGRTFGSKIRLLHCYHVNPGSISPYGPAMPTNFTRELREAAAAKLHEWGEKAGAEGLEVSEHLSQIFPSEGISSAARELDADLIVMGTRGLTGLKHVMLGSVAERTIRSAPCPVLTVNRGDDTRAT